MAPRDPSQQQSSAALAQRLDRRPATAPDHDEATLHALIVDFRIDPRLVERACWAWLRAANRFPAADEAAAWLEADGFARDILHQTQVTDLEAERLLTVARRTILLGGRADFPLASAALIAQAAHNGGCWPFDAEEEAALAGAPDFAAAYLPPLPGMPAPDYRDPVTRAVAAQFGEWPYPTWQRVLMVPGDKLAGQLSRLGPGAPQDLPEGARILVAGCGTGAEAVRLARRAPEAHVVAIDLSAASLDYARERAGDVPNLEFRQHDLHEAAALGAPFDHISCCGVLHHLPDPEAGWRALAGRLRPGGTMRVMLYSRIARLQVDAARARISDLLDRPATPALIRTVRARMIAAGAEAVTRSPGFFTMSGVRDLLLYEHEDRFDIPRIARALDSLGLDLLNFALPDPQWSARYDQANPDDPWHRDFAAWAAFERSHPRLFAGMYDFTCVKPA